MKFKYVALVAIALAVVVLIVFSDFCDMNEMMNDVRNYDYEYMVDNLDSIDFEFVDGESSLLELLVVQCNLKMFKKAITSKKFKPLYINQIRNAKGSVPLISTAAVFKCADIVSYLIEMGADVNARCSSFGYTPLHYALVKGDLADPVPQILLNSGADLGVTDKYGRTPIELSEFFRERRQKIWEVSDSPSRTPTPATSTP